MFGGLEVALPFPGFTAAQLYFRSTELPSIFGLTSSTGSGATPMGGKNDEKAWGCHHQTNDGYHHATNMWIWLNKAHLKINRWFIMSHILSYFCDIFRENKQILVKWTLPRWRVQVGSSWCNMSEVRSALGHIKLKLPGFARIC